MRSLLLTVGILATLACSEVPQENTASNSNNSTPDSTDNSPGIATADLVADMSFDFSNQNTLTVQADLPQLAAEDTVVNICLSKTSGDIDRSNCLLRTQLEAGALDLQLDLAAHQQALVLEIWQRSDMTRPQLYRWSSDQGALWQITP